MGDTYRSGGAAITHAPTMDEDQHRYHSNRDMTVNPSAISGIDTRRYHSTRDMQVRPTSMHDLRCYSASYASYSLPPLELVPAPGKSKHAGGGKAGYVPSSSFSTGGSWRWVDPELQRRKRVASYKAYGMEGKVKGSVKKGWRWVREKYRDLVHGVW